MTPTNPRPHQRAGTPVDDHDVESGLLEVLLGLGDDGPALMGVELGDDVAVHVRPCLDPADDLLGWTAPASWDLIGTCARGTVRRGPDASRSDGERTTIAHLLARSGRSTTALRSDAGDVQHLTDDQAVPGLTSDACRRALGLPTAAPMVDATEAVTLLWFDALVCAASRTPGLDDRDCWHLHPALPLAPAGTSRDLAARCLDATDDVTWAFLREQAATGSPSSRVDAEVAAWCDDGAFSRLVLASLPDVTDLIDGLEALVPAGVASRLLASIAVLLR